MIKPLILGLGLAATCVGCLANAYRPMHAAPGEATVGERQSRLSARPADAAKPALTAPDEPTPHLAAIDPRQVVYTATLAVVVPDVPEAVTAARALAQRLGGYVQRRTGRSIIIRVPAGRFSQALAELERAGTVTDRDVRALDVTEQYVDLTTRLSHYQALMTRLQGMLSKAKTVKEILEIEDHLRRARTEIERLQGRLNVLNSRIAYSTITANFTRTAEGPPRLKPILPFWWLTRLGLDDLMHFGHVR